MQVYLSFCTTTFYSGNRRKINFYTIRNQKRWYDGRASQKFLLCIIIRPVFLRKSVKMGCYLTYRTSTEEPTSLNWCLLNGRLAKQYSLILIQLYIQYIMTPKSQYWSFISFECTIFFALFYFFILLFCEAVQPDPDRGQLYIQYIMKPKSQYWSFISFECTIFFALFYFFILLF